MTTISSPALAAGSVVRHRRQPGWGTGRVSRVTPSGANVELVVQWDDGQERKLRLRSADVATLIEVVPREELDAREVEARATRAARRARTKAMLRAPATEIGGRCAALTADPDAPCVVVVADTVRVLDAAGSVVEEIERPDDFAPTRLEAVGEGLFVGTRTHEYDKALFVRRGGTGAARLWRSPVAVGITRCEPARGVGAVVDDRDHIVVAQEGGGANEVPFSRPGRRVETVRWWGHDLLVGTCSDDADDHAGYFRFHLVGGDGVARFEGLGASPAPVDDDTMLVFRREDTVSHARDGAVVGRSGCRVAWPDTITRELTPFARCDDGVLVAARGDGVVGLVAWHPREDRPRWSTELGGAAMTLLTPVRVGRFVATTSHEYSEVDDRRVWIVDAATGAVVHELEIERAASRLVAVGDDALVVTSYTKRILAFTGLGGASPARLLLTHDAPVFSAASPAPGVVVTDAGEALSFFRL